MVPATSIHASIHGASHLDPCPVGAIHPSNLVPATLRVILARLGLKAEGFAEFVRKMGKVRRIAIGSHEAMVAMAARVGRKWLQNSHSMDGLFR